MGCLNALNALFIFMTLIGGPIICTAVILIFAWLKAKGIYNGD